MSRRSAPVAENGTGTRSGKTAGRTSGGKPSIGNPSIGKPPPIPSTDSKYGYKEKLALKGGPPRQSVLPDSDRGELARRHRAMKAEYDAVVRAVGIVGWRDLLAERRAERNKRVRHHRLTLGLSAIERRAVTTVTTVLGGHVIAVHPEEP